MLNVHLSEIYEILTTFSLRLSMRIISLSRREGTGVHSHRDIAYSSMFCDLGVNLYQTEQAEHPVAQI